MKYKKLIVDGSIICILSSAFIFPKEFFDALIFIFSVYDFSFLKIFSVFIFVKYRKNLQKWYKKITQSKEVIDGVPIEELLDFLFATKKFPAKEVKEKFGISAKKYSSISSALARAEIIEQKPPYNSYILNDSFSRADVFSALSGKNSFSEILKPMKIFRRS